MDENRLAVIDGETLADMRLPPTRFCVQTLLPQGVTVLGGAPKVGKSWLVLDLCVRVAKGEPLWNLPTARGATLYLCLEDTARRVQERLLSITDDVPANAFFAVAAKTLANGLCEQVWQFVSEHPDTVLVAVDTFQMVRVNEVDTSYANDYQEIRQLKKLADELSISLLLVHHLRKQGDSDPLNKLSGTTGISGAVDAVFVLDKSRRNQTGATLICTGRDIEYRELELNFHKENCAWELIMDSAEAPEMLLPKEMAALIAYMRDAVSFSGSNAELMERLSSFSGNELSAKALKQMMNKWRYQLEDNGVRFKSYRSNGQRLVDVIMGSPPKPSKAGSVGRGRAMERTSFRTCEEASEWNPRGRSDSSDGKDANTGCVKSCVICDPCVPAEGCGGGDFSPAGSDPQIYADTQPPRSGGSWRVAESQHRICLDVGLCSPPAKRSLRAQPAPSGTEVTA